MATAKFPVFIVCVATILLNSFILQRSFSTQIFGSTALRRRVSFANAALPHTRHSLERPRWGVISPKHTIVLANVLAENLRRHSFSVAVFFAAPLSFDLDNYVVLCAHVFDRLPPFEKLIVYQLEQSVSSRWFTPLYWNILRSSRFVLEYSLTNIGFLKENMQDAARSVVYLPVGASMNLAEKMNLSEARDSDVSYDVLFYGDSLSSKRRRHFLDAARAEFRVLELTDTFGLRTFSLVKQAFVVLNIHYYENGLLETPRISECISLGTMVVSESSSDVEEYPEFSNGAVRFFEQGSVDAMMEVLREVLKQSIPSHEIVEAQADSAARFSFMVDRFLLGAKYISQTHIHDMPLYFHNHRKVMQCVNKPGRTCIPMFVLSTPESRRLQHFVAAVGKKHNYYIYD